MFWPAGTLIRTDIFSYSPPQLILELNKHLTYASGKGEVRLDFVAERLEQIAGAPHWWNSCDL